MSRAVGFLTACALVLGLAVIGSTTAAEEQQTAKDPEIQKLVDAYTQAWGKGDAKALAALHTADAIRAGSDAQIVTGRAAIETAFVSGFAGPLKGTTLRITRGQENTVATDVRVGSGTWELSGGTPQPGSATRGTYVNTLVREGGRWLIASSAVIGAPPGS